ncbi:MAG: nucleotidyltransferase domain-containing protein [Actinobacteria bacterium]|nr:nucleotidyltransferase domain-containing protein [Actinomycetota bacterium]
MIVFGSRAKGDALLTSDYDIAVVSDDFKGMKRFERTYLLLDVWAADLALEAVAYTEEEFMKATGMLVWDILEDGVAFKDKGVFRERKKLHDDLKAAGKLKKVEGGWAF